MVTTVIIDKASEKQELLHGDRALELIESLVSEKSAPIWLDSSAAYIWMPEHCSGEHTFEKLPPFSRAALMRVFYAWGATYAEIGEMYSLTRERVRQILVSESGVTVAELKEERAAILAHLRAARGHEIEVLIANFIDENGPSTVSEVADVLQISVDDIKNFWPRDKSYMKISNRRSTDGYKRWSRAEIVNALVETSIYYYPLTKSAYDRHQRMQKVVGPSSVRIMQVFGTWSAACQAAGVEPGRSRRGGYQSKWTDQDLLAFVKEYLLNDEYGGTFIRYDDWRRENRIEAPSGQTLRNRLGSWDDVKITVLREM